MSAEVRDSKHIKKGGEDYEDVIEMIDHFIPSIEIAYYSVELIKRAVDKSIVIKEMLK